MLLQRVSIDGVERVGDAVETAVEELVVREGEPALVLGVEAGVRLVDLAADGAAQARAHLVQARRVVDVEEAAV